MKPVQACSGYELRFGSLFDQGRACVFPCDAQGHVDLDSRSQRGLINDLDARTVIGREFSMPGAAACDALKAGFSGSLRPLRSRSMSTESSVCQRAIHPRPHR